MQSLNKTILLIRGLPGSGKTTLANALSENGKYNIFSVDQYFTDEEGNYSFNYLDNHKAYDECKKRVMEDVKRGAEKILVDNTFTLDWEMEPYFKIAKENDYMIFVFTVENYHGGKNVHGISEEQVRKMGEKYKVRLFT